MASIPEAVKKGPVMTMTLKCDIEFPKALKNLMISLGMKGEAVYKGFPVIDEDQEYWWVQLHLYENQDDDHKKMGRWMFTNSELYPSFFDSARCAAWRAITELGERLRWRLHNTQKDLKEEKEDTTELMEAINQLQDDKAELAHELSVQKDLNIAKDNQIATLKEKIGLEEW
jgi:hypothetical protein